MSDYNEMLISQAGGDGPEKLVDLRLEIAGIAPDMKLEILRFTNLPMARVKDAIDLLNDDHVELISKNLKEFVNGQVWNVPTPHRTKDFTVDELFPHKNRVRKTCEECGAWIPTYNLNMHTNWHNKLLP